MSIIYSICLYRSRFRIRLIINLKKNNEDMEKQKYSNREVVGTWTLYASNMDDE